MPYRSIGSNPRAAGSFGYKMSVKDNEDLKASLIQYIQTVYIPDDSGKPVANEMSLSKITATMGIITDATITGATLTNVTVTNNLTVNNRISTPLLLANSANI